MLKYRAVLFDLDGTLLDTLADIAESANLVLAEMGLPGHPVTAFRHFVGEGVSVLFERALPPEQRRPDVVARCARAFQAAYASHWNVHTRVYEGIPRLLDGLAGRRIRLAILSNKPDDFTRRCAEAYLSDWHFDAVLGQRPEIPRKPDAAGALEIACRLALSPGDFLYLGDSSIDVKTAIAAGMRPVGAGWGFRSADELRTAGADLVAEHPLDVLHAFFQRRVDHGM
jgi:phosphoglycolate phosphatase